jgi:radical SAM-linked protein
MGEPEAPERLPIVACMPEWAADGPDEIDALVEGRREQLAGGRWSGGGSASRLAIVFAVRGRSRFLSHLESVDVVLRALRRAGQRVALSQGMKPKPLVSLAMPRGVGTASEAERCEVVLQDEVVLADLAPRLAASLPAGFVLLALEPLPPGRSAASRLRAARMRLDVAAPATQVRAAAAVFLSATEWPHVRRRPGKPDKTVDLRRYVQELVVEDAPDGGAAVSAVVEVTGEGSIRPEEIVTALGDPPLLAVTRTAIELSD